MYVTKGVYVNSHDFQQVLEFVFIIIIIITLVDGKTCYHLSTNPLYTFSTKGHLYTYSTLADKPVDFTCQ